MAGFGVTMHGRIWVTPEVEDARSKIEAWRGHYNESRPHTALGDVPPSEFASKGGASPALAGSARPGIFTP
jgi:transposase InsO family protein